MDPDYRRARRRLTNAERNEVMDQFWAHREEDGRSRLRWNEDKEDAIRECDRKARAWDRLSEVLDRRIGSVVYGEKDTFSSGFNYVKAMAKNCLSGGRFNIGVDQGENETITSVNERTWESEDLRKIRRDIDQAMSALLRISETVHALSPRDTRLLALDFAWIEEYAGALRKLVWNTYMTSVCEQISRPIFVEVSKEQAEGLIKELGLHPTKITRIKVESGKGGESGNRSDPG